MLTLYEELQNYKKSYDNLRGRLICGLSPYHKGRYHLIVQLLFDVKIGRCKK